MTGRLPAPLVAYRLATWLAAPFVPLLLASRLRKGKEEEARLGERRGFASWARPDQELVWAHGASIGETLSLLPVVEALVARGLSVLVTSGTTTSAAILANRLPPGAFHHYVPLDSPGFVGRFLDHWQPRLALFAESEIWPNMILELERREVPLVLVNGRLSPRSHAGWQRAPATALAPFGRFTSCLAQSEGDARRLASLGATVAGVAGNLKFDSRPPPADPAAVERLSAAIAGRPVWLAASTHPGEEEMVLAAHRAMADRFPRLLTMVAPRHPDRAEAIADLATLDEVESALRSRDAGIARDTAFYVVDTVGELGLFYRLAPLVLMGGSLVPHGGQNPIEAARLGAAILHGPHTGNFDEIYQALDASGGALAVEDGERLAEAAGQLLGDTRLTRDMARSAAETVGRFTGALDRTMAALAPFLPSRAGPGEA